MARQNVRLRILTIERVAPFFWVSVGTAGVGCVQGERECWTSRVSPSRMEDDGASEVGGFQGRAHRDTADENRALIKLVHFLFIDTRRGWHLEQTA